MSLKIVKANEPINIERINLCIYAPPGVGKTSLGFTADDPLDLDFDGGVYRAANRKDSVPIATWADVESMTADDLRPYKTIIVDTAGRALDKLSIDITSKNPKMGSGTDLTLKGWGVLKHRFSSWTKLLKSYGSDIVQLCHMDEQKDGERIIERLDAQGSSKNEIYKAADVMGRIFVREEIVGGKRVIKRFLDFSPREGSYGKNPGQLAELEFPSPTVAPRFLSDVISLIKGKLNQLSEEQQQAQGEMEEWTTAINDLSDVDDFNRILPEVKKASEAIKMYFHAKATDKGLVFDKKQSRYSKKAEKVYA